MKFKSAMIYTTQIDSRLGGVTLAATDQGLAGVWFDQQKHSPDTAGCQPNDAHPVLREASRSEE
ncbi:MAG: cysteine methyltransferase, partial [Variovorax sp.]|nr:cysteine methyltransferase [Variovorax sp.]